MLPAVRRAACAVDQQDQRALADVLDMPAMGFAKDKTRMLRVGPSGAVFGPVHAVLRQSSGDRRRHALGICARQRHIGGVHDLREVA